MTDIYEKVARELEVAKEFRITSIATILREAFVPRVGVGEPVGREYTHEAYGAELRYRPDARLIEQGWTETPLYPEAALATLQAQLAEKEAELARVREAFGKRGFSMTEPNNPGGSHPRSRKLVIGFENGDDADDAMGLISQLTKEVGHD